MKVTYIKYKCKIKQENKQDSRIKMEVKIVSSEVVKPSIPTPSHLKKFTLSYVDQITIPSYTAVLLFYNNTTSKSQTQPLDIIARLKTSLSKTLTHFYPLAGRVQQSTIICNDEGIPFIETRVDECLSDVLNSSNILTILPNFLPPRNSIGNLEEPNNNNNNELIHLSYQINIFNCGGFVIGWYDIHKITDGTSATMFLKNWAAVAKNQTNLQVQPNFNAAIKAFPPLPKLGDMLPLGEATKNHVQESPTVVKSFVFSNTSVRNLKSRAWSERVPNPSRLQAVAGFLWENTLRVTKETSCNNTNENDETVLYLTLDMRPWMDPPLPKESFGNLATMAVAKAERKAATLAELVAEIHVGVSSMKEEIRGYKGENAVEILRENWNQRINTLAEYEERAYKVVSWCNVGFNDLDFGFGKPDWVVPTDGIMSPIHKNLFVLNDYVDCDGNIGVEAWLFLEAKQMEILESDHEFLTHAMLYYPLSS